MVVLPFNSVINPLIYDNKFRKSMQGKIQLSKAFLSSFKVSSQRWKSKRQTGTNEEIIEMEQIQNVPSVH
jgi:hypothetical protein